MNNVSDESPVSDTKMDISEATSREQSPGIMSPDSDQMIDHPSTHLLAIPSPPLSTTLSVNSVSLVRNDTTTAATTDETHSTTHLSTNNPQFLLITNNYTSEHIPEEIFNDNLLDNNMYNQENSDSQLSILSKISVSPSNNTIRNGLTITNDHPLMPAPSIDDSDSDDISGSGIDVVRGQQFTSDIENRQKNDLKSTNSKENILISGDACSQTIISSINFKNNDLPETNTRNFLCSTSDESDPDEDLSKYHATLTSFQAVALVSNCAKQDAVGTTTNSLQYPYQDKPKLLSDDDDDDDNDNNDNCSIDTISNQSFHDDNKYSSPDEDDNIDNDEDDDDDDDDIDDNLLSVTQSSSFMDEPGATELMVKRDSTKSTTNLDTIPQYSARDEARDSRNWQKITLPDGNTREIDMKVIEPYKRVLSHGGYLKAGGHNAIVVFSACHLPDKSRTDYHYVMDNLFLYVVKTLEQLVTEDYVLVYLHGGSSRSNVPPFPWLKKCYQLIDRRLRKSLKNLFMVHPTFWLKSVVWMARPFLSSKFWRKLVYVRSLEELYDLVPVEKAAVPEKVKKYDVKCAS